MSTIEGSRTTSSSSVSLSPGTQRDAPVVLVVYADGDARQMYRQMLASQGWNVYEAADGRDALVQFYRVRPQAVLLDARLPYIDGQQLCALLRGDHATGTLRIVATVSDASPDIARRFRERGADEVFLKPVSLDVLALALRGAHDASVTPFGDDGTALAPSRPVAKVRAHGRYVSTEPPQPPPNLRCPHCDTVLQYDCSHVGGVNARHREQWDYFICPKHGAFRYRQRTRKLRRSA